jgi:hypothetical protein
MTYHKRFVPPLKAGKCCKLLHGLLPETGRNTKACACNNRETALGENVSSENENPRFAWTKKETSMYAISKSRQSAFRALSIAAALIATMSVASVAEAGNKRLKLSGSNGTVNAVQGANGTAACGRGAKQNADGSKTFGRGCAGKGVNGGQAAGGATTTIGQDGSVSRKVKRKGSGTNGSYATEGGFTRNADGSLSGGRKTTGTNNKTGNSYSGTTTIDPNTGKPVRNATCTNASGEVIACPLQ